MTRRKRYGEDLFRTHSEAVALRSEQALKVHVQGTLALLEGRPAPERIEGLRSLLLVMRLHEGCTRTMIEEVTAILDDQESALNWPRPK
jgi:hypothetical protein